MTFLEYLNDMIDGLFYFMNIKHMVSDLVALSIKRKEKSPST